MKDILKEMGKYLVKVTFFAVIGVFILAILIGLGTEFVKGFKQLSAGSDTRASGIVLATILYASGITFTLLVRWAFKDENK